MQIMNFAYGADQRGFTTPYGSMVIGVGTIAAMQRLSVEGSAYISDFAHGAAQFGAIGVYSSATNEGKGAMQLLNATPSVKHAWTTTNGYGSLMLGYGLSSNQYCIVAGNGAASHGNGSVTAVGGFWGPGTGITGMTPDQVGAVPTNGVSWLTNTFLVAVYTNESGAVTGTTSQTIIYLGAP
jgi:hypothetical protein